MDAIRNRVGVVAAVVGVLLAALIPVGSAQALATPGYRNLHFSVFNGLYGATAKADVCLYKISSTSFRSCDADDGLTAIEWHTSLTSGGGFAMNAVCVDWEDEPDHYSQLYCIGGSSTTLDDVLANGTGSLSTTPTHTFTNQDGPAIRVRFYGVGPGSIENRYNDYQLIG